MPAPTPMQEQYNRVKRDNPDAIVLFRLGDFYEMFHEDARIASKILDIALTSRGRGTENEAPMCGVPHHAAESYVARLVKAGYRVVLCDQVEDASKAKGLVRREVVRVVSPGTVTDPGALDSRANLYLAALCREGKTLGAAYADLSTGDFRVAETSVDRAGEALGLQFAFFRPRELVLSEEDPEVSAMIPPPPEGPAQVPTVRTPGWTFGAEAALRLLTAQFETSGLEGFGCASMEVGVRAAGALLQHLRETQRSTLDHFTRLLPFLDTDHLILDETTLRTLEVVASMREGKREGTLLEVLDRSVTPMGARLLRSWLVSPPADLRWVEGRHDAVADMAARPIERGEIRALLGGVRDIERILGRLAIGTAGARDLVALRDSLGAIPSLHQIRTRLSADLIRASDDEDTLRDVEALLRAAIADEPAADLHEGGIVRDGYSPELDDLRAVSRDGRSYIAGIEARERERTGIASLKVRYNRVFGYYIEVSKPNLHLAPQDYERKQTLVGAERFVTPELKAYEEKVLTAQERIGDLEYEIFCEIRARVAASSRRIRDAADAIARLDVLASFAESAVVDRYVRPRMTADGPLRIRQGRHPVVESVSSERFVPNDVEVGGEGARILILTGPNMGGKSTYLRQTALITLMAHAGSFVPATEALVPLVDRIFSRVGASDSLASGLSTFMVEMTETANILNNATPRSLVLLDEVGRGTATFDGLSLAWAIVEHLHGREGASPMTLFATHYHEMTDLSLTLAKVRNFTMAVRETPKGVVFLRRVIEGASDRSYGIQVARLAGLPGPVIDRAREILANLESDEVGRDGMPRLARHGNSSREARAQLTLFGGPEDPAAEEAAAEIRGIDPDTLAPIEALQILFRLHSRLKGR